MATTYEEIATVTVGSGGASTVDFTSIPSDYTDLVILFSTRNSLSEDGGWSNIRTRFNGDTGSNYTTRLLAGRGSGPESASVSSTGLLFHYSSNQSSTANTFSNGSIYIFNYAGSSNKSVSFDSVTENNATEAIRSLAAGLWSNTSAITSISCAINNGGTFNQHTTFYLYGIKNTV